MKEKTVQSSHIIDKKHKVQKKIRQTENVGKTFGLWRFNQFAEIDLFQRWCRNAMQCEVMVNGDSFAARKYQLQFVRIIVFSQIV